MIIGDKINSLTYLERLGKITSKNDSSGLFKCDCGKEVIKLLGTVRGEYSKYCSRQCPNRPKTGKLKYKHKVDGKYLCVLCRDYKKGDEFHQDNTLSSKYRDGKDRRCKECKAGQSKWNNKYDNLDRILTARFLGLKERAEVKGILVNISKQYLLDLWYKQQGKCALSGITMTHKSGEGRILTNVSIDRINSLKGYIEDNIQLVCMAVNQMKSDLTGFQLLQFCKSIINHHENTNNKCAK